MIHHIARIRPDWPCPTGGGFKEGDIIETLEFDSTGAPKTLSTWMEALTLLGATHLNTLPQHFVPVTPHNSKLWRRHLITEDSSGWTYGRTFPADGPRNLKAGDVICYAATTGRCFAELRLTNYEAEVWNSYTGTDFVWDLVAPGIVFPPQPTLKVEKPVLKCKSRGCPDPFQPYAEPNQADGSFICFSCRSTWRAK